MYCERCKLAFAGVGRCPACGGKHTRDPLPEDPCYLTETDPMFGGMLKDVLEKNGIPVMSSSAMGAGMAMRVGPMFDRIRFYVPCARLTAAAELVEELFSAPEGSDREPEDLRSAQSPAEEQA